MPLDFLRNALGSELPQLADFYIGFGTKLALSLTSFRLIDFDSFTCTAYSTRLTSKITGSWPQGSGKLNHTSTNYTGEEAYEKEKTYAHMRQKVKTMILHDIAQNSW